MHARAYENLLDLWDGEDAPSDILLAKRYIHAHPCFSLSPALATQHSGFSDIRGGFADYSDLLGALPDDAPPPPGQQPETARDGA